ncbi:aldehyde dehydrogenase family protein [Rubrobacter marinus]|uniref:Aldehyde dehydrogenase family protein n=1 Tax=Rubrobacter marinus TaxID=2653852 RepID=A0A6G8PWV6_9ACTN|nr:aldehyde dehydrogenase family protein [Rubrobacter marinus]QIN78627.1 aldehyde dehydrogenase family protein [Rubrobacter marinus]
MTETRARSVGNHIGGEVREAASGGWFENRSPTDGELLGLYARSGAEDVGRAVEKARAAFEGWRLYPAPKRGEILYRAGALMAERKEEFARAMSREMGKVLSEARGDVQEGIDMAFFAAGEGRRMLGDTVPAELPEKFAMSIRMPIGVVGLITPWNFPVAIPSWKSFPALVAGNTIVLKPAEDAPECARLFTQLLLDAGLPEGVFNTVFGLGEEAGAALVEHPGVAGVSFTGSTAVGVSIAREAHRTHKKVATEMGGKNAIILMDDADVDLAVEGAVWSAFGTAGQRCTAASRLIVHERVLDEFTEGLVRAANALKLGDPLDEGTDVGPLVNEEALRKVSGYVEVAKEEGATLLCGGERATEGDLSKGNFFRPTIWGGVDPGMRIAQEEIFGPAVCVIPVSSYEEAVRVNNGTPYGLSSAIYTRDVNTAFRAMRDLYTGINYVNAGTIGAEIQLPFGGTKATGGHREVGQQALDSFTEWKSIYVDYSGKLQKAQIDEV